MAKIPKPDDEQTPAGLLNADELLKAVFPNVASRPSLRWLRRMQAKGLIPHLRCGRLVFFDAAEVRRALDQSATMAADGSNH